MKVKEIDTPIQRLKIYEAVLAKADLSPETESGLCVDLRQYSGRNYFDWYYHDTKEYFPEFRHYYPATIDNDVSNLYMTDIKAWRIMVLKNCIKLCKQA